MGMVDFNVVVTLLLPLYRSTAAATDGSKSSVQLHNTAEPGFLNIVLFCNYEQPRKEMLMCCPDKCRNSKVDGFVGLRKKRGDGQNDQITRDI